MAFKRSLDVDKDTPVKRQRISHNLITIGLNIDLPPKNGSNC